MEKFDERGIPVMTLREFLLSIQSMVSEGLRSFIRIKHKYIMCSYKNGSNKMIRISDIDNIYVNL